MRSSFLRLAALLAVAALLLPAAPATASVMERSVWSEAVGEPRTAGSKPKCEGFAPQHFHCRMTWQITGAFKIRMAWANTFWGVQRIRWETSTGSGESRCWKLPDPTRPPTCEDTKDGHFEVGQTLTITAVTVGSGYWLVEVT